MLAILADDLTGALDSAAPFAGRGLRTDIALDTSAIDEILEDKPDVVAINVKTREISAREAYRATADVLEHLPSNVQILKKVDSRLKGNIIAELDAMRFGRALVAPAIPEFDRLVRKQHVCGFGVAEPISIRDRLGEHATKTFIPDTLSPADMAAAVKEATSNNCDLLVGARGLADALARRMSGHDALPLFQLVSGSTLMVVGSRDPITIRQVTELCSGYPVDYLPAPGGIASPAARQAPGVVTLVQAVDGDVPATPQQVSANLADCVVPELTDYASILLLTGGATAEAVLAKMQISRFQLLGECMPGMGIAFAKGRHIITKSGGFGEPDTLQRLAGQILGKAA